MGTYTYVRRKHLYMLAMDKFQKVRVDSDRGVIMFQVMYEKEPFFVDFFPENDLEFIDWSQEHCRGSCGGA